MFKSTSSALTAAAEIADNHAEDVDFCGMRAQRPSNIPSCIVLKLVLLTDNLLFVMIFLATRPYRSRAADQNSLGG